MTDPSGEPRVEFVLDRHLECVHRRALTKRGVSYLEVKLRRSNGHPRKFTVPAAGAESIITGGFYKLAILADAAPGKPIYPEWKPGDRALLSWNYAGARIWNPVIVQSITPRGRLVVRHWRRVLHESNRVLPASLTPASEPFPALDDPTVLLPGDEAVWRQKQVTIGWFVGSHQAWVSWTHGSMSSSSKIVPLGELAPATPAPALDAPTV